MFSALHDCKHVSLWRSLASAPNVGERITCIYCGEATHVVAVYGAWRAKCQTCNRLDITRTLQTTLAAHVTRHVQKWSTHRVRVWQWGDTRSVHVITARDTGTQLELVSDAPF